MAETDRRGRALTSERILLVAVLVLFFSAVPFVAFGDMGVPMIMLVMPGMVLMLIPVIALEAWVLLRRLSLRLLVALQVSAMANMVSTLVGVPVAWVLMFVLQAIAGMLHVVDPYSPVSFAVLGAAWVAPPGAGQLGWVIPTAMLVLLVPCFFASWGLEYWTARMMLRDVELRRINRAVLLANLLSYALLTLVVAALYFIDFSRFIYM